MEVELTEDETEKILQKKLCGKFDIVSSKVGMLGEWVGLCGDHAVLNITAKDKDLKEKEHIFFIKLYPRVPFVIDFIEGTKAFKKEIFIYKLFALFEENEIKILNDCVPRCYLSVPKKFLILDNLIHEGYKTVDKHQVFDYETSKVVLAALAKLHASTLIYEEKNSCRLIDHYDEELEENYYDNSDDFANKQGLDAAFLGILNMIKLFNFPEKLLSGKDFRQVLDQVLQKVFHLVKPSKTFRNVICHGDIWATNLLLKYEDDKAIMCKLVDFQCARYTPPVQDVMSVIHLTTCRDFRKRYMYNLLGIYYSNLEKYITLAGFNVKKILPFEEFLSSSEEQKVFGMVQAATYFPLILLKSHRVQEYFANKETNKEALLVDRSILVRDEMEHDEQYKNRIFECMQDLKDYCDYL